MGSHNIWWGHLYTWYIQAYMGSHNIWWGVYMVYLYPGLYGITQYMVRGQHGISISRHIWDHTIYGVGSTWYIQAYIGSHNIWWGVYMVYPGLYGITQYMLRGLHGISISRHIWDHTIYGVASTWYIQAFMGSHNMWGVYMVYPGLYGITQYMVRGLHGISRLIWDHTIYGEGSTWYIHTYMGSYNMVWGLHGISRLIWDHTIWCGVYMVYLDLYGIIQYGVFRSTWYIQTYMWSYNMVWGLHGISRLIWDHTIYGEGSTWYIQTYMGSYNIWWRGMSRLMKMWSWMI